MADQQETTEAHSERRTGSVCLCGHACMIHHRGTFTGAIVQPCSFRGCDCLNFRGASPACGRPRCACDRSADAPCNCEQSLTLIREREALDAAILECVRSGAYVELMHEGINRDPIASVSLPDESVIVARLDGAAPLELLRLALEKWRAYNARPVPKRPAARAGHR